jgi:YD repeat-containing protein
MSWAIMSAPVLVLLYLADVLSYFAGTIPHGEPCEIRSSSSSERHAFTWNAEDRLVGVESYASDQLRLRAVLRRVRRTTKGAAILASWSQQQSRT